MIFAKGGNAFSPYDRQAEQLISLGKHQIIPFVHKTQRHLNATARLSHLICICKGRQKALLTQRRDSSLKPFI